MVIVCGIVFLSLIQKFVSIGFATSINPYDASSALLAGTFTSITMIVFALLLIAGPSFSLFMSIVIKFFFDMFGSIFGS